MSQKKSAVDEYYGFETDESHTEFLARDNPADAQEIDTVLPVRSRKINDATSKSFSGQEISRNVGRNSSISQTETDESPKSKRRNAWRESTGAVSVDRIRRLLGDGNFYDPDKQPLDAEFVTEKNWTAHDLMSPTLRAFSERTLQRKSNEGTEQNALAAVENLRAQHADDRLKTIAEYDRDGSLLSLYRIWSLIPPVYKMNRDELAQMLSERVLYNKDDIIAINKPYGISTTRSITEGENLAVATALGKLRPMIAPKSEKLYVMHRLDKTTTGVLLLAASRLRATEIHDMFKEKKITKKYQALVRNVPDPLEGIINIPLIEEKVGGRYKTIPVVRRGCEMDDMITYSSAQRYRERHCGEAVTEYKVLEKGHKCALVECTTNTGYTHQIRCHLGFGIGTPIIGDHKYTEFLRYVPQRLPGEMLTALEIRSQKSRELPMHLHAREVILPEIINGRNIQIRCLLPKYFVYVMRRLRIKF